MESTLPRPPAGSSPGVSRRVAPGLCYLSMVLLALVPLATIYLAPLADPAARSVCAEALARPIGWSLAARSLGLAALAAALAAAIGLPVGLSGRLSAGPGRTLWTALALVPLALPPYLAAIAWIGLTGDHGLVRRAAAALFGDAALAGSIFSLAGCAWVQGLALWPCVALLVRAGREGLDPAAEEAARVHLPPRRALRCVFLPAVRRELLLGVALAFVLALADFSVPSLLQVDTYALEVFTRFEMSFDSAASAVFSLPILLAVVLLLWGGFHFARGGERGPAAAPDPSGTLTPVRTWAPLGLALIATLGAPVFQLLLDAGGPESYARAFGTAGRAVGNTVFLSVVGAGGVGAAGLLLALLGRSLSRASTLFATGALALSFALPAALVGIGLALAYNRPAFDAISGGPAILLLAYLSRFLVVPYRLIAVALPDQDPALDAARVHGLAPGRILQRVLLPALGSHLQVALLVLYVLILGELGSVHLVQPPGWETLPIRLFQLSHYGYEREVAALAVILLALVLLPVAAAWPLLRPQRARAIVP